MATETETNRHRETEREGIKGTKPFQELLLLNFHLQMNESDHVH